MFSVAALTWVIVKRTQVTVRAAKFTVVAVPALLRAPTATLGSVAEGQRAGQNLVVGVRAVEEHRAVEGAGRRPVELNPDIRPTIADGLDHSFV